MSLNKSSQCHSAELCRQLAHQELTSVAQENFEAHLGECDYCQSRLLDPESDLLWKNQILPVLQATSEPQVVSDDSDGKELERQSFDSVLRLLGPTDDPESMGRIGTYEVVGILGRGGMGVVFKAFEPVLNRFVAIKMLLPHLAESGASRKRFAREARAAAAVIDDHVTPIYNVAEWQGVPYLVTLYSRGTTLQKRIHDQGPLELKEILRIGLQTARGLAAAHAQGIVHRDVKPSNILLDGSVERAMLTDFGLARAADDASITRTGMIAGTPQYMSPEQARGEPIDHRSDLFSLGSVIYATSTGHPPFRADNMFGVLHRVGETAPRSIQSINSDLPAWLDRIVSKLMAKDPAHRFATAGEVADLLEQCLAHVQQPTSVNLPREIQSSLTSKKTALTARIGARWLLSGICVATLIVLIVPLSIRPGTKGNSPKAVLECNETEEPLEWDALQEPLEATEAAIRALTGSARRDLHSVVDDSNNSPLKNRD
jgi:serine/threonine protein kinase